MQQSAVLGLMLVGGLFNDIQERAQDVPPNCGRSPSSSSIKVIFFLVRYVSVFFFTHCACAKAGVDPPDLKHWKVSNIFSDVSASRSRCIESAHGFDLVGRQRLSVYLPVCLSARLPVGCRLLLFFPHSPHVKNNALRWFWLAESGDCSTRWSDLHREDRSQTTRGSHRVQVRLLLRVQLLRRAVVHLDSFSGVHFHHPVPHKGVPRQQIVRNVGYSPRVDARRPGSTDGNRQLTGCGGGRVDNAGTVWCIDACKTVFTFFMWIAYLWKIFLCKRLFDDIIMAFVQHYESNVVSELPWPWTV